MDTMDEDTWFTSFAEAVTGGTSGFGFIPGPGNAYPEVEHCFSHANHEPHFHVPAFVDEDDPQEFICGGVPRKVHSIEESGEKENW